MKTFMFLPVSVVLIVLFTLPLFSFAQELKPIELPEPQMYGGSPLMQVLKDRKTSREFSHEMLPRHVLSNLLWAAFGINRPESGRRTAPSASNRQEIDIYAATAEGLYIYNAKENILEPVLPKDIRAMTGTQAFVKNAPAPVVLVYVADYSKMGSKSLEGKAITAAVNTGFISQNVYLYCASEGLATVVRGLIDRTALAEIMKLRPDQNITFAQSIGYPKK